MQGIMDILYSQTWLLRPIETSCKCSLKLRETLELYKEAGCFRFMKRTKIAESGIIGQTEC